MDVAGLLKGWFKQGSAALIGGVAGGGLVGMVSLVSAHQGPTTAGVIHACINNASGTIKVITADGVCGGNEVAVDWNAQGVQGPPGAPGPKGDPGVFNGTFRSPNGLFSLSITDTGMEMSGPGGKVALDGSSVAMSNTTARVRIHGAAVEVDGPMIEVDASVRASVTGTMVHLNGNCAGVATTSDRVNGGAVPYGGGSISGALIQPGSPSVFAC